MTTHNISAEQRAENFVYSYMGILRARYLSTETLLTMMEGWTGEHMLRDIPVWIVKAELTYRGQCILNSWCRCR